MKIVQSIYIGISKIDKEWVLTNRNIYRDIKATRLSTSKKIIIPINLSIDKNSSEDIQLK